MSEVHLARDLRLHRDVAVKVLRADLARDPSFYLRFRREAQNAAALNHPAIVAVYDTGEAAMPSGPLPYIVMEYVDGVALRDIVHTDGPMPPRRALEVIADACQALNFSHQHGIIHRDVKPANIMISKTGAVKVMDFGIARAIADGSNSVTQTAAVIGTAQYLSPEQAAGNPSTPLRRLLAGVRAHEVLTGQPPFVGDTPFRWPTSTFARILCRRRNGGPVSRRNSTRSCSRRWPRIPTTAIRARRRCVRIWFGFTAGRSPRRPGC